MNDRPLPRWVCTAVAILASALAWIAVVYLATKLGHYVRSSGHP